VLVRFIIVSLTLILCAALWIHYQTEQSPSVDVVGGPIFDAGSVNPNATVTHTFQIVNRHVYPLGVAIAEAGCTCTTASVASSVIPPFGSTKVTLHIDPEGEKEIAGSSMLVIWHEKQSLQLWLIVNGEAASQSHLKQ
jgi:hypothetical protein